MSNYEMVKGSKGFAPVFSVTFGLKEGYGEFAKTHAVSEVVELIEAHLKKCAANSKPYLTGIVSTGELVYAWPEGEGKAGSAHESSVIYSGNKSPLYNSNFSDEDIETFLNALASEVGEALGQTRVYVAYNGVLWILEDEEKTTPTGN